MPAILKAMKDYKSLSAVQNDLKEGVITCAQLVEGYLEKEKAGRDLNIFREVFAEEARSRAVEIDTKLKEGTAGRLAGMVLAIKDNICVKGHHVGASSKILEGFESLFSATAITRLLAEDVILIGRTNCDEFAMGGSNENSAFGPVKNPLNPALVPGGSSGGSAAAVAAGMALAALGSDTGGSIRQPASFCGLVGLKPTYGRISRHGLIAYASSFDQIGPFSHTVEDSALLLEIMAGADGYDSTASSRPVDKYSEANTEGKKYRIAYLKDYVEHPGLDPEIKGKLKTIFQDLIDQGHTVEAADFPMVEYLVPAYYVLTTAEASSNLSRFSGITYGYRSPSAKDTMSTLLRSRSEGFGAEVKRRIMLGTFVLSAGYYDAYYTRAQKVRRKIRERTREILENYDLILTPTTPKTAFEIGAINDPVSMYLEDIFTVHANLAGVPAVSIPVGTHSNGMPFGIQVMSDLFEEAKLLAFSKEMNRQ